MKIKSLKSFTDFMKLYLKYYHSKYWEELELDLKHQGFYEIDYPSDIVFKILCELEEEKDED